MSEVADIENVDIGEGHSLQFLSYQGSPRVAVNIFHMNSKGEPCAGFAPFANRAWANSFEPGAIATWDVQNDDPLTITPSILCRACGDHGYVTNGRWVKA